MARTQCDLPSYIVLGLIEWIGQATPYHLKQRVAETVGNFWSVPHSQLYAEPELLAASGHLSERREQGGRRRRLYSLTDPAAKRCRRGGRSRRTIRCPSSGTRASTALLRRRPASDCPDPARRPPEKLRSCESAWPSDSGVPRAARRLAVEAGLGHEREGVRSWGELAGLRPTEPSAAPAAGARA